MKLRAILISVGLGIILTVSAAQAESGGIPEVLRQLEALTTLVEQCTSQPTDTRRLYYLTPEPVLGNQTLTACASGFHFASLWEIFDTSNLKYDVSRGYTVEDAGEGPPTFRFGWLRTGWTIGILPGNQAGQLNCNVWTDDTVFNRGTVGRLSSVWTLSVDPSGPRSPVAPWEAGTATCDNAQLVWCVQD